jgi:hypothetical protein
MGEYVTDYPSSSPHVVGVGGTTMLINSDGTYRSETAWSGSGGGVSNEFPPIAPQTNNGINPINANPGDAPGRGVPDMAANADPATGYSLLSGTVGGTSGSAPLIGAFWLLAGLSTGKMFGDPKPLLYAAVKNNPSAVHDIVSGSNGAYPAGPGWDGSTGLGSPDGVALTMALTTAVPSPAPPAPAPSNGDPSLPTTVSPCNCPPAVTINNHDGGLVLISADGADADGHRTLRVVEASGRRVSAAKSKDVDAKKPTSLPPATPATDEWQQQVGYA